MSNRMTKDRLHMGRVAEVGCILCRQVGIQSPAEVHHIGDSSERSNWLTIPLCREHHRGGTGFHGLGEREFNRRYKTSEIKLLALTMEAIS